MAKNLQNQIHMYSLDTSAFYNNEEQIIHRKLLRSYQYRKHLKSLKPSPSNRVSFINKRIKDLKNTLSQLLQNNKEIRTLNVSHLRENNVISIFESVLTRTLGLKHDTLTEDIFVVRTYYFNVLKDLIRYGFIHNGEKYIYFSSSAGQIRTKKGVWIKEDLWEKHKNTLTCGLTTEDINKQGGSNINKYLAYIALTNSATTEIKDFDIHRTIVVDDLETNVHGLVDYIDRDTYQIKRKEMDIPIEHTDGCGMVLPSISEKSFMIRLPFVKGLLVPFPYDKFAKENNQYVVKDIYGKEWDILKDNIQYIFTKSQFKMSKYYQDWEDYKEKFNKYSCQAAMLNEEEDEFPEAKLNYQMLQTLTDITDEELEDIAQNTIDDILEIGSDKETMLRILGVTSANKNKNYFQQALDLYPELLNDAHARQVIKNVKRSLVKDAKSGKLSISGKYTFACPDLYAFCERLFLGEENPKGLLENNQVYCNLFDEGKVDVLRSPHLYREHGIKDNVKSDRLKEWFITDGIYTSIHDTISKLLQFDNDGDRLLVIDDPTFVEVAKRNMNGIVPLYYEMAVAPKQEVNHENIYVGLIHAFKANIGIISNNISKIWNSDDIDLSVIKWLCMENNFVIDYAKTLFMPTRPEHIEKQIKEHIKGKVPHFFIYAKDKEKKNVEKENNSTINRLSYLIPNKRIYFKKVAGKFDYKMLMRNPNTKVDEEIIQLYDYLDRRKKWLINDKDSEENKNPYYIYTYIKNRLLELNSDVQYVTDVLIKYLYTVKSNSNSETLWHSFGDIVLENLTHNLNGTKECAGCGKPIIRVRKKIYCDECAKMRERTRLAKIHENKKNKIQENLA